MPAPRKHPLAVYDRIFEVMRQRAAIPTDKELAREIGCAVSTVRSVMRRARNAQEMRRSTWNPSADELARLQAMAQETTCES